MKDQTIVDERASKRPTIALDEGINEDTNDEAKEQIMPRQGTHVREAVNKIEGTIAIIQARDRAAEHFRA
eukprot:11660817-Heterocapsa_arctica.AAC.1